MKLWEGLEQDLNYNAMVSQRGVLNLFHSDPQRDAYARRGNAMRLHGVDAELLDREQVRALVPFVDFDNARFPIHGGLLQRARRHGAPRRGRLGLCPRGRPARRRHHPELRGRPASASRTAACSASRPSKGFIGAKKVALAVRRQLVARRRDGGLAAADREPCRCRPSSPRASSRVIDVVMTFGAGHFYVSQSDKGGLVFGGDIDGYNSYAQRGNLPVDRGRLRGRHGADAGDRPRCASCAPGAGCIDMSMDGSPIIDQTPIDGLYLNAGWCYGGFKATPASGWCFAHLIATDEPHPVRRRLSSRPLRDRPRHRRKGHGRAAQFALRPEHAHHLSLLRRARRSRSSPIAATPR